MNSRVASKHLIGFGLIWAGLAMTARAQEGPAIERVTIGFAGLYKVGHWTPVQVTVSGAAKTLTGRLRLTVADGNGLPSVYEHPACRVSARGETHCVVYARFGQLDNALSVEFLAADGSRLQKRFAATELPDAVRSSQRVIISLGPELGVDEAIRLRAAWLADRVVHAHVEHINTLPDHWLGYGGVDAIVVGVGDWDLPAREDALRWQALVRWTQLGGTVVLATATRADSLIALGPAWSSLVPGQFDRVTLQRQTTGIEQFAEATHRLDQASTTAVEFAVPMAVLQNPRGVVEVYVGFGAGRLPAVIRQGIGLGRVIFVAFDLDREPFRQWSDRPRLVARLLDLALGEQETPTALRSRDVGQVASQGVTDLIGQLRIALDQFNAVRLVPFSLTAGLITVYILLIGPVDYWWLKRRRRLEWTWLTFPLAVLGFLGLAAGLAVAWKGRTIQINHAEIVDVDLESGWVRGTSWTHVFSPRTARLAPDLAVRAPSELAAGPQRVLSWEGLPGDSFGGLDSGFQPSAFSQPYEVRGQLRGPDQAHLALDGFPVAIWSSRSLLGRWWTQAADLPPLHTELVEGPDSQLEGAFRFPLTCDLTHAYLLYDRWIYALGTVEAAQRVSLAEHSALDLRSWLTQRRVVNGRNVTTPWNHQSTDVDRILQLVMFYEAANGRDYTQLRHDYQRFLDLSDQLKLKKALLVGQTAEPATEVVLPGQTVAAEHRSTWTYYRILFPVQERRSDGRD